MKLSEKFGRKKKELPPTNFYVLRSSATEEHVHISKGPKLPLYYDNWCDGKKIDIELSLPLEYLVEDFDEHGGLLRSYYYALAAPLMSKKLIKALRECGVNNLDTYDANIRFLSNGKINQDYQAVNIIGLVKAANMNKSNYTTSGLSDDNNDKLSVWFDNMIIDEESIKDLLFFRMAESLSTVLVHKSIKEEIEKDFPDLKFYHPQSFSG